MQGFRHIVVAVDFSPGWEAIRGQLDQLPGWGCERMTLAHVLASHYPQVPAVSHTAHYEARLGEVAEDLRRIGLQVDTVIEAGDPAAVLIDIASRLGADCVLAGSHGHSTLTDFFIGSTVLNLARLTSVPLLLVPVQAKLPVPGRLSRVVLGSDCSEAAGAAEQFFLNLIEQGVEGVAVCAIERGDPEDQTHEQACAQTHVERLNRGCRKGLRSRIERGVAPEVILRVVLEESADLVVVGKRGHNRMRELLLGSTAEAVCRRAHIPVALIPATGRLS